MGTVQSMLYCKVYSKSYPLLKRSKGCVCRTVTCIVCWTVKCALHYFFCNIKFNVWIKIKFWLVLPYRQSKFLYRIQCTDQWCTVQFTFQNSVQCRTLYITVQFSSCQYNAVNTNVHLGAKSIQWPLCQGRRGRNEQCTVVSYIVQHYTLVYYIVQHYTALFNTTHYWYTLFNTTQ